MAVGLAVCTFTLVAIGGTVTSYDAGMAVPEGWNTFGYGTLTTPLDLWWHRFDTRVEHGHRIMGQVVGYWTIAMLVAVLLTQRGRAWLKWSAAGLLAAVIAQGVLGATRVNEVSYLLAAVHGVTGQMVLCLVVVIALATGRWWMSREAEGRAGALGRVPVSAWVLLGFLLLQLSLGSAVRHSQSALAIPDWPLHYGQVVPPLSQAGVDAAVDAAGRAGVAPAFAPGREDGSVVPGTYAAWQVHLHFAHRLGAYATTAYILAFVGFWWARVPAARVALALLGGLLVVQIVWGVWTVLSGESGVLATLHQSTGALLAVTATGVAVRLKLGRLESAAVPARVAAGTHPLPARGATA